MADIFISYSSEDRDRVIPIVNGLQKQGWSVWYDRTIPPGKTFDQVIEEAITAAKCIIVLWSKNSIKSEWVKEEATRGKRRQTLVPALIDPVEPPLGFGLIQAADLTNWKREPNHGMELEVGNYHVEVAAEGYETQRRLIDLEAGSKKPYKFELVKRKVQEPIQLQKTITNSIGMEFILIPAESFTMGSRLSTKDLVGRFGGKEEWFELEKPPRVVKISQPFYLQKTEVSQGQWKKVVGNNPSDFKQCGDDCPVEKLSWYDAKEFIKRLNTMEGTDKYRLPSEAEWEYACRAGTTTEYSFGDDSSKLGEYAWYGDNSNKTTHPIATKKPNPWGLYDVHGNVWEWVEDDRHDSYEQAKDDGSAWINDPRGSGRMLRGGSWDLEARYCRSAGRGPVLPDARGGRVGFRLARSVAPAP